MDYIYTLIAFGIIALIVITIGFTTRCPNCKSWWKRSLIKQDHLGTTTRPTTITKRFINQYNHQTGKYDADIDKSVSATETTKHYLNHYRCKNCYHYWTKETSSSHTSEN